MSKYIASGASISADFRYRYLLWREWRGTPRARWLYLHADGTKKADPKNAVTDGAGSPWGEPESCLFIMLNPSTADGDVDDPTIRRCVGFAKRLGFERLEVANLFARRCTSPKELFEMATRGEDIIGPRNQEVVEQHAADAGMIICAWGTHGIWGDQDEIMHGWLDGAIRQPPRHALGLTAGRLPRHPLYLRSDSVLVPCEGRVE